MKKISPFPFKLGLIIFLVVVIIILGGCFLIHDSWKYVGIKADLDFTSINNSIALVSLALSTITVIFVYLTYELQNRQMLQNKSDSDYTRALDHIYKQYEISKEKMELQSLKDKISRFISQNNNIGTISLELEYILIEDDFIKVYSQVSHFIMQELEFVYNVLERSHLEVQDKMRLAQIIPNNLNSNFYDSLVVFCNKVDAYSKSANYPKGISKFLPNIANDAKKIMKYLFLN